MAHITPEAAEQLILESEYADQVVGFEETDEGFEFTLTTGLFVTVFNDHTIGRPE
jgi:hypothetical protein